MERDWFMEAEVEAEESQEDFLRERIAIAIADGMLDEWDALQLALECWNRYTVTHGKQG
jgi:hypothetical protein